MTEEEKNISDREQVIQIISDGAKTEYWKLLQAVILQWKKEEQHYLDSFKSKGVKTVNIAEYNRSVDRLEYLDKLSNINQTILSYNKSIIVRMKSAMNTVLETVSHAFMSKK